MNVPQAAFLCVCCACRAGGSSAITTSGAGGGEADALMEAFKKAAQRVKEQQVRRMLGVWCTGCAAVIGLVEEEACVAFGTVGPAGMGVRSCWRWWHGVCGDMAL